MRINIARAGNRLRTFAGIIGGGSRIRKSVAAVNGHWVRTVKRDCRWLRISHIYCASGRHRVSAVGCRISQRIASRLVTIHRARDSHRDVWVAVITCRSAGINEISAAFQRERIRPVECNCESVPRIRDVDLEGTFGAGLTGANYRGCAQTEK